MKAISKNAIIGYPAGIITGVTYGLNPLFALPLMKEGASTESILFVRYIISVLLLGAFLFLSKQSFRINKKEAGILFVLGLLYTSSSIFLFEAFKYIASGLATALVFLDPVLVAIIMVFLKCGRLVSVIKFPVLINSHTGHFHSLHLGLGFIDFPADNLPATPRKVHMCFKCS